MNLDEARRMPHSPFLKSMRPHRSGWPGVRFQAAKHVPSVQMPQEKEQRASGDQSMDEGFHGGNPSMTNAGPKIEHEMIFSSSISACWPLGLILPSRFVDHAAEKKKAGKNCFPDLHFCHLAMPPIMLLILRLWRLRGRRLNQRGLRFVCLRVRIFIADRCDRLRCLGTERRLQQLFPIGARLLCH